MPINKEKSKTAFVTMDLNKYNDIVTEMQHKNIKSFSRYADFMIDQYIETRKAIKEATGIDADSIADAVKMLLKNK
jgi:uridine kinase